MSSLVNNLLPELHKNQRITFSVVMITSKQTNKQTNERTNDDGNYAD